MKVIDLQEAAAGENFCITQAELRACYKLEKEVLLSLMCYNFGHIFAGQQALLIDRM